MHKTLAATPILAIVLWFGTFLTTTVHAEQDSSASQQTGQALTNESLSTMLSNMGYEPKALSKGFLIAKKVDSWTINVQVVLSPNLTKIGMNANLGKVDKLEDITAPQLLTLLISNGDIDPSCFYIDRDQKKVYLHRSLDNRAVTPAFLREQIDAFCGNVRSTADQWKFTK
jgi:hypothetical protein